MRSRHLGVDEVVGLELRAGLLRRAFERELGQDGLWRVGREREVEVVHGGVVDLGDDEVSGVGDIAGMRGGDLGGAFLRVDFETAG